MSRRALFAVVMVALLALGAAAKPRKAYVRFVEHHTRELILYSHFETALILRGTYLSGDVRAALADERRRLLAPTDEDHAAFVETLRADGAAYHEVVFSADSAMADARRFGPPGTVHGWSVRLEADGHDEKLVTCTMERNPNPLQRSLYPHFNRWSDLWIARFEKTVQNPREIVLVVGSGYGNGRLVWQPGR
jgi:hypothetical protein